MIKYSHGKTNRKIYNETGKKRLLLCWVTAQGESGDSQSAWSRFLEQIALRTEGAARVNEAL